MEVPLDQHMVHTHNEYLIGDKELNEQVHLFLTALYRDLTGWRSLWISTWFTLITSI